MRSIFIACCLCATSWAQAYAPIVTMNVRTPDGQVNELSAHESGLATLTVKGQQYAFRPTMYDDKGNDVLVTIFKMGSPDSQVGAVETGRGKPAVDSKTTPDFKISIGKVVPNQS